MSVEGVTLESIIVKCMQHHFSINYTNNKQHLQTLHHRALWVIRLIGSLFFRLLQTLLMDTDLLTLILLLPSAVDHKI